MAEFIALYECGCIEVMSTGELLEACPQGRELYHGWLEMRVKISYEKYNLGRQLQLAKSKTALWLHLTGDFRTMDCADYYHSPKFPEKILEAVS